MVFVELEAVLVELGELLLEAFIRRPARRWTLPTLHKLDFSGSNLVGKRQTPIVTNLCRKRDYFMPRKGRDIDISTMPRPKVRNPGRA